MSLNLINLEGGGVFGIFFFENPSKLKKSENGPQKPFPEYVPEQRRIQKNFRWGFLIP